MNKPKEQEVRYVVPKRMVTAFVIMGMIMFLVLGGFAWVITDVQDLGTQNKNNIYEIQHSRLDACVGVYQGIKKVFTPFFPKGPTSKEAQEELTKFNHLITTLTKKCEEDTDLKDLKKGN